jgi:hypothetical protein
VVNFAQTHPGGARQISRIVESFPEVIMAVSKSGKHKEYAQYAEHCLEMVPKAASQEYRAIQREMAAEWIKLADSILQPLKPTK